MDFNEAVANELFKEYLRITLNTKHLPVFWSHFDQDKAVEESLHDVTVALNQLYTLVNFTTVYSEMSQLYPDCLIKRLKNDSELIQKMLRLSLGASIPDSVFSVMVKLLCHSLTVYESLNHSMDEDDGQMETETNSDSFQFWNQFQSLTELLCSGGLLQTFLAHPSSVAMERKVKSYINEHCSETFDTQMLTSVVDNLQSLLHAWLSSIYGHVTEDWRLRIQWYIYYNFGQLRIHELFDIIVEFPDSKPALLDLKECLSHTDLRQEMMTSLKAVFERRLLHPGANTADIITQYVSSIRGLRILDHSGVVLERVCEPVRTYLRTREDTITCIMASLIDDSNNELAEELAKGDTTLLDLSEECDDENQDFEAWEPDPVDADPSKTSKSRQTSDIISILVHIYGSQEMFVSEYRTLLADRLLQSLNYDISRELRNLELLKLRFGESSLHFCEVMMKDITDSRRINALIHAKLEQEQFTNEGAESVEINSFILSHVFWPSFRKDNIKIPEFVQKKLDSYNDSFKTLKGMRRLEWCHNLGLVQLDLEVKGCTLSFQVSPPRACIIWHFQEQKTWTVEELSLKLESQPSVTRRHLVFWVSQGVLYEDPLDNFNVIEEDSKDGPQREGVVIDDDDDSLTSIQDQKENDTQMIWSYISAMLTNLGPMPLERIQAMLKMFMSQGPNSKEMTAAKLKTCLDKKVKSQELVYTGGTYQLNKLNN